MTSLPRVPSLLTSFPGTAVDLANLTGAGLANAIRTLAIGQHLSQENRLLQLEIGTSGAELDGALLICHADINEQVCEDESLRMRLLCQSSRPGIPEHAFLGQVASVSLITDRGTKRRFNGIVTRAVAGPWSGSEQAWLVEIVDYLTMLGSGCKERIFLGGSVLNLIDGVLRLTQDEHNHPLDVAWDLPWEMAHNYPERKFRMQTRESIRSFILRHARRYGLGWRITAGTKTDPEGRGHTIHFFDASSEVPANVAGNVAFQRDWATQQRDAINEWMSDRRLTPGIVLAQSWDHQARSVDAAANENAALQGEHGAALATVLMDQQTTPTRWGDDRDDFDRITYRRAQYHAMQSHLIRGSGSLRDAHCYTRVSVSGLPNDPLGQQPASVVFTQVHHFGQNNFGPEKDQRLQDLFTRAGWQTERPVIEQRSEDNEDRSHYGNTFVAVPAGTSIVPHFDLDTHWPKVHATTVIVVGKVEGNEVDCDEWGRYAVCFPGMPVYDVASATREPVPGTEFPMYAVAGYPQQVTSAYVPLQTPQASNGFGMNTPPRVGDQMLAAFLHGSPDHPVLTGGLHSTWYRHSRAEGEQAMPGNRNIASLREKEVGSDRTSELLIDSTPAQTRVQIDSDHTHSRIVAGFQVTPRRDGQAEPIGEGIYQSTDAAAATRAAKGILQSAWARLNGSGRQLDYQEALNLMETGLALFKSMSNYATQHQGTALDAASQTELKDLAANWQAGTNTDPNGEPKDTALIALTAPQGIAANTTKTIAQFAGENVDTVAQQHMQLIAGQRYTVNAGQGITQFAHDGGIRQVAHKGDFTMQAQHGNIVGESAGDIRFSTANGTIRQYAQVHEFIAADGSFARIGDGGITFGTNGPIQFKAASFPHSGPSTMQAPKPSFGEDAADQRYQLHVSESDGPPAANCRYEIELSDGTKISGISDANGLTELMQRDAMHIARLRLLNKAD